MSDYRGGDIAHSGYNAQLVKDIRAGQTERQRKRNFTQKLYMTGAQVGLTAARGVAGAVQSKMDDDAAKAIEKARAAKQYAATPPQDYDAAKTLPGEYHDEGPAWLKGGAGQKGFKYTGTPEGSDNGKNPYDEQGPIDLSLPGEREGLEAQAKAALARQVVNDAASGAPVAGRYAHGDGPSKTMDSASSQARDLHTGFTGIHQAGGMMGSDPDNLADPGDAAGFGHSAQGNYLYNRKY